MSTDKKISISNGEWAILQVVWRLEPVSAVSVKEEFEDTKNWSYSTVKTMMDRMTDKGLLRTERIRNLMLYSSAISARDAKENALTQMLNNAFDGALSPMIHFLIDNRKLSGNDLDELRELIDSHEKKGQPKRKRKS